MKSSWRATCIQIQSDGVATSATREAAWPVIAGNIERAVVAIRQARAGPNPPQLVVLPEFAFTGAPLGQDIPTWISKACYAIPGAVTAPLQALAKSEGIYIGGNLFESDQRWPGRYFNSCFLIAPSGEIVLRFRRINTATFPSPHDFMQDYVGEYGWDGTFPVVDTELGRIGMIACGEIAVPEVSRALMMQGAEIILHPTNEPSSPAQDAAKIARAAENMVYVISANVAGGIGFSADGSELGGHSRIIDYRGNTIALDETTTESIDASTVIDLAALRAARRDPGMANALLRTRWDMYRSLYENIAVYPANQFLETPMSNARELAPVLEVALANLAKAGIAPA
jgi:predicted amidohydrolase